MLVQAKLGSMFDHSARELNCVLGNIDTYLLNHNQNIKLYNYFAILLIPWTLVFNGHTKHIIAQLFCIFLYSPLYHDC